MGTALETALRHAPVRDHVAVFYRDQREQFAATVPFIRTGIERGERCLYVTSDNNPDTVRDALRTDGLDVAVLQSSDTLQILPARDVYLRTGRFEKDSMLTLWADAARRAIESGHTGLRATGDLSWSLSDAPGAEHVMAYERELEDGYRRLPANILCQYNSALFPKTILDEASKTHARLILDGALVESSLYVPPSGGLNWSTEAFAALVTPYLDGELPESTAAEVARRIKADPELRRRYKNEMAVKNALKSGRRHATPPRLRQAITEAILKTRRHDD
jgi:chemotaxis family two-component system sensor kinase Cph1